MLRNRVPTHPQLLSVHFNPIWFVRICFDNVILEVNFTFIWNDSEERHCFKKIR
jgi:hypothetical protein